MDKLNLPQYSPKIRKSNDGKIQIWDSLRMQYVALTPEEWVRQHFINYLTEYLHYPKSLMTNEVSISLNNMTRRCDTVLYSKDLKPKMIVEYKRPSVNITQKVFDQICRYNLVMHVDYLVISNGVNHYCCKMDYEKQTYRFLKEIPHYSEL
ncbi:MAG: type I restriction enzyme HsdR N-terminal domain-containing protein [Bacteroidaceae bacterium]|nr:type I restriction enzyme HsdR N-terminal domain-containing protein [Bacteroidaceae bacterium]